MKKFTWELMFCLFSIFSLDAQSVEEDLAKNFEQYQIVDVDARHVFQNLSTKRGDLSISLPGEDGEDIELELYDNKIFSDNLVFTSLDDNGISRKTDLPKILSYHGNVRGDYSTKAILVTDGDFFFTMIKQADSTVIYEPLAMYGGSKQQLVRYRVADVKPSGGTCAATMIHNEKEKIDDELEHRGQGNYRAGQCYIVDYGVVVDSRANTKITGTYGMSVSAFVAAIIAAINTDYDADYFDDELRFELSNLIVSTSTSQDVWENNPTVINEQLDQFTDWGVAGGGGNFEQSTYNIASLWTGRDLPYRNKDGSLSQNTIGLAWLGLVCRTFKYNVLQTFTGSASGTSLQSLRVLVSHEIGHNFNARHDPESIPSDQRDIMYPSVNPNFDSWSQASVNAINTYYQGRTSCFGSCGNGGGGGAPVANFTYNLTDNCAPGTASFSDASTGNPTSWEWTFEGGNPASSTQENPSVYYEEPGTYNVSLTVSNSFGSDTYTRTNYISVYSNPVADFNYTVDDQTVTFTNLSEYGDSYSWDFGDGNSSSARNPVHTYNDDGTYEVSLIATNVCKEDNITRSISVIIEPVAEFTVNVNEICAGDTVQYSDQSIGNPESWNWLFPGGSPASSNSQNPEVMYATAGDYSASLSITNPYGQDTREVTQFIRVNLLTSAGFSYTREDRTASFINESIEGDSFVWDFGDGSTSSNSNPDHTYLQDGIYNVVLTSTNGCNTDVISQDIAIATPPAANFVLTSEAQICAGTGISILNLSSDNTDAYEWKFSGTTMISSTDEVPEVIFNNPGFYDIILIVANESGADTMRMENALEVLPLPFLDLTITKEEGTVTFNNNSQDNTTYQWSFGDGSTSADPSPLHSYLNGGEYEVILKATNDCGEVDTSFLLSISIAPEADFSYPPAAVCIGDTVQFINTSLYQPTSFEWIFAGSEPSTSMLENPTVVYFNPGQYGVTLTVGNVAGNSSISKDSIIHVLDNPVSAFQYEYNGLTVELINQSLYASEFLWDFGDGNSSNEINPEHTYSEEGIYEVQLISGNGCKTDTSTIEINLYTVPVADFDISIREGCIPFEVSLKNLASSNAKEFYWILPGSNVFTSVEENPTAVYTVAGTYSISLIVRNPSGKDTIVVESAIIVNDVPEPGFSVNVDELTATYFPDDTLASHYFWEFGDGITSDSMISIHTYTQKDTVQVRLLSGNQCGLTETVANVEINGVPMARFTSDTSIVCVNTELQLVNESSSYANGFLWITPGGTSDANAINPSVIYTEPGIYDIGLISYGDAGNDTLIIEDYVEVISVPEISYRSAIVGDELVLVNTTPHATNTIWSIGNNTITGDSINYQLFKNGSFSVILTVDNGCGSESVEFIVEVEVFPEVIGAFEPVRVCLGEEVILEFKQLEGVSLEWQILDAEEVISENLIENDIEEVGNYDLLLIGSNSYGVDTVYIEDAVIVEGIPVADFSYDVDGALLSLYSESQMSDSIEWNIANSVVLIGDSVQYEFKVDGQYAVEMMVTNACGRDVMRKKININIPNENDPAWAAQINVFPNPVHNILNIEIEEPMENMQVFILDSGGKSIETIKIKPAENFREVDMSYYTSGIYVLRFVYDEEQSFRKVLKVK